MSRHTDFTSPPANGAFDAAATLAARRCGAEIAIVRLNDSAAWVPDGASQAPASISIHADQGVSLSHAEIARLGSPDAAVAGKIKLFVGVPLRATSGEQFGTLAVLDREAREIGDTVLADLKLLAAMVADSIELWLQARLQLAAQWREPSLMASRD
jgi:hypothetical protein